MSRSAEAHAASGPQAAGQVSPWPRALAAIAAATTPPNTTVATRGTRRPRQSEIGARREAAATSEHMQNAAANASGIARRLGRRWPATASPVLPARTDDSDFQDIILDRR